MAIEVGKNRLEALGEVEETADLLRYYSDVMERNDGYDQPMDNLGDPTVHTRSILRPFGVFAVISPFNFPMALAGGPTERGADRRQHGRLQAVEHGAAGRRSSSWRPIATPASPTASSTWSWARARPSARSSRTNPGIDGIVFTGSYEVGFDLFKRFSTVYPRPCIVEMGGKNPAIVTAQGGPRGGRRGHHALGLRLRRAEVLGQQPGLRRAAGPRRARPPARREDREAHHRRPAPAGELARARSSTSGRWTATRPRSPRPAATGPSSPAASG